MSLAPPKTTNADILASIAAGSMSGVLLLHSGAPRIVAGAGGILGFCAIAIAATDRKRFIIPDHLATLMAIAGLTAAAWSEGAFSFLNAGLALLQAALCGGLIWLARNAYFALRGREGLGFGDVKLAAAAGCWLDPALFGLSICIASMLAIVVGVVLSRRKAGRPVRMIRIPFGAYWAPTIWLVWMAATYRESAL